MLRRALDVNWKERIKPLFETGHCLPSLLPFEILQVIQSSRVWNLGVEFDNAMNMSSHGPPYAKLLIFISGISLGYV